MDQPQSEWRSSHIVTRISLALLSKMVSAFSRDPIIAFRFLLLRFVGDPVAGVADARGTK